MIPMVKYAMLTFWPYFLSAFLILAMPLLLAWVIHRQRGAGWGLFFIGAATFVGSQILHIPFNWLVLNKLQLIPTDTSVMLNLVVMSLFLGLSAGVFEEGARYLTYRFWTKDARSWGAGLMLGVGHGGIEAILVGVTVGLNALILGAISLGFWQEMIPPAQTDLVQTQIAAMQAAPWYLVQLGAAERAFAISVHLALSLLVMQVFVRGRIRWLLAAIGWHALFNAAAVFTQITWENPYLTEGVLAVMALISLGIVFALKAPEPVEPEPEPLTAVGPAAPQEIPATDEALERSKYS